MGPLVDVIRLHSYARGIGAAAQAPITVIADRHRHGMLTETPPQHQARQGGSGHYARRGRIGRQNVSAIAVLPRAGLSAGQAAERGKARTDSIWTITRSPAWEIFSPPCFEVAGKKVEPWCGSGPISWRDRGVAPLHQHLLAAAQVTGHCAAGFTSPPGH